VRFEVPHPALPDDGDLNRLAKAPGASAVEAIEMVTIVVGVGATRGWRSTWIGTASGFGVLAVIPALHIIFSFGRRMTPRVVALCVVQSLLLVECLHNRATDVWAFFAIAAMATGVSRLIVNDVSTS